MTSKRTENKNDLRRMRGHHALYVRAELMLAALSVLLGVGAVLYFALSRQRHTAALVIFLCAETAVLASACGVYFGLLVPSFARVGSAFNILEDTCVKLGVDIPGNSGDLAAVLDSVLKVVEDAVRSENRNEFLRQQAELLALQSQINPHFLYNSLETIRGEMLARGNPDVAEMTEALAKFFRYNISKKGDLVELSAELENLDNYIAIQQYRFGSRVRYSVAYHNAGREALDCLLPKLTLQPLVENAILHGIDPKLEGGDIVVHVDATDKNLIITVSDNGVGMDIDTLHALRERLRSGGDAAAGESSPHVGIAIVNIDLRLKVLWGREYGIGVTSTKNLGTDVELTMPITRKSPEDIRP